MSSEKFYPLRPIQRMLIDTHLKKAKSTMMNIGALLKLPSGVDIERLADSINETLNAHDIFKCRLGFNPVTGELSQTFDSEAIHIEVKKFSDEEFSERVEKFKEPFKFIGNPLYRIYLFETPTAGYFYADFYHAIMDGASVSNFFNETDLRYRGRKIKNPSKTYLQIILEDLQFADDELDDAHEYWKKILSKFDRKKHLPPVDVQNISAWSKGTFNYTFKNIGEEFFRNTRRNEQIYFLGAAMLALTKITGANDSVINLIDWGRNADNSNLMGLFMEDFPCYKDFGENLTAENFLNELEGNIRINKKFRKGLDIVYDNYLAEDCATFIFMKDTLKNHVMIGDNTAQIIDMPPNEFSASENSLDIEVWTTERGTYDLILNYDASRFSSANMKNFAVTMDKIIGDMKKDF